MFNVIIHNRTRKTDQMMKKILPIINQTKIYSLKIYILLGQTDKKIDKNKDRITFFSIYFDLCFNDTICSNLIITNKIISTFNY